MTSARRMLAITTPSVATPRLAVWCRLGTPQQQPA